MLSYDFTYLNNLLIEDNSQNIYSYLTSIPSILLPQLIPYCGIKDSDGEQEYDRSSLHSNYFAQKFDHHMRKMYKEFMNWYQNQVKKNHKNPKKKSNQDKSFMLQVKIEFKSPYSSFRILDKVIEKITEEKSSNQAEYSFNGAKSDQEEFLAQSGIPNLKKVIIGPKSRQRLKKPSLDDISLDNHQGLNLNSKNELNPGKFGKRSKTLGLNSFKNNFSNSKTKKFAASNTHLPNSQTSFHLNPQTQKEETKKNMISLHLKPLTMLISNLTLKKIMQHALKTTIQETTHFDDSDTDYDRLMLLKKNLMRKPLSFFENEVKELTENTVCLDFEFDNVAVIIYDSQPFLADEHVLMIDINEIKVKKGVSDISDFKTMRGAWTTTSVSIKKLDIISTKMTKQKVSLKPSLNETTPKNGNQNSRRETQNIEKVLNQKIIQNGMLYLEFRTNLIQNHPILTNSELQVLIPKLEIQLPRHPYSLVRFIDSLLPESTSISNQEGDHQHLHQHNTTTGDFKTSNLGERPLYEGIMDEIEPLLRKLLEDHFTKSEKKDLRSNQSKIYRLLKGALCKHCVMKYRKSCSKMRIILGYPGKGQDFHLLKKNPFEQSIQVFKGLKLYLPPIQKLKSGSESSSKKANNLFQPKKQFLNNPQNHSRPKQKNRNFKQSECINIPYLDFVSDSGIFRTYQTLHMEPITSDSESQMSFNFQMKPYWRMTSPEWLESELFLENFWDLCLSYEQDLRATASSKVSDSGRVVDEAESFKGANFGVLHSKSSKNRSSISGAYRNIRKGAGFSSYSAFSNSSKQISKKKKRFGKILVPINQTDIEGQQLRGEVYLAFFGKFYHNKNFLLRMERYLKAESKKQMKIGTHDILQYKDLMIFRFSKVFLSINGIDKISFLVNYASNFLMAKDLYTFFRDLQTSGSLNRNNKKLVLDFNKLRNQNLHNDRGRFMKRGFSNNFEGKASKYEKTEMGGGFENQATIASNKIRKSVTYHKNSK